MTLALVVGSVAGAGALAGLLRDRALPITFVAFGGVGLIVVLGIVLARIEAAVVLGTVLLSVVFVQPAPPDAIFATVIAVALVTGRMALSRFPLGMGTLLGLLLVLNLVSAVFAVDPQRAARFLLITFYLVVFAAWLTTFVDSQTRARNLLLALFTGGAVTSVCGVAAYAVPLPGRSALLKFGRVRGLFEDPNVFGPFMVLLAVLVLAELLEPRLLRRRAPLVALFGIFAAGVVFAFSRAAWLNAALALMTLLAVYTLRRRGGKPAFYLLLTLVTAVAALAFALALTHSLGFLEERARFQSYDVERFHAQRAGFGLVARHPFGIGPGQFERLEPISAHSLYVRALAEQGVLGLAIVILIMIATLIIALRNVSAGRDTYGIGSAPLLAAWIGLVANSIFVDTLHWRHLWLVAALIWAGAMRARRSPTEVET